MTTLSMSALPRVAVCAASAVLPQHEYGTQYAVDGTSRHAEMEAAIIRREYDKLPAEVAELLADYPPDGIYAELTMFYDFVNDSARSAERRESRVDRYASALPYEIPGTADVVAIDRANRRGLVVDWKGWEEVGAAAVNLQTTGYAMSLAKLFDLDVVIVAIAYLGEGKQHVDIATIDGPLFDLWKDQLANLQLAVTRARRNPLPVIGRQCRWCPAWEACPTQKALALELRDDSAVVRYEGASLEDDATAAEVYDWVTRARVLLKRTSDALYARAARRPIPLRNGQFFGRVERPGNLKLTGDVVYNVVRALHGQEAADRAVGRDASQASIKRALKAAGVKSVEGELKAVLKRVAEMGGSSRKPTIDMDVVDASHLLDTPERIASETTAALDAADQLLEIA